MPHADFALTERIQAGDFEALADPAFELHLLAEPEARWWCDGSRKAAQRLALWCAMQLPRPTLADRLEAWGLPQIGRGREPIWLGAVAQLRSSDGPIDERFNACLRLIRLTRMYTPSLWKRTLLDLTRELRSRMPSAPAEVDTAIAMLERYALG